MTSELLLSTATLLLTLDLIGTFVFALSGAASGVKHRLDAFGVGVLAFVAGNAAWMESSGHLLPLLGVRRRMSSSLRRPSGLHRGTLRRRRLGRRDQP